MHNMIVLMMLKAMYLKLLLRFSFLARYEWEEASNMINDPNYHFGDGNSNTLNESAFPLQMWKNIPPPPKMAPPPPPTQIAYGIPDFIDLTKSTRALPNGIRNVIKGFEDNNNVQQSINKPSQRHHQQPMLFDYPPPRVDFNDTSIRSVLHVRRNDSYITYGNTRWKIYLKKEVRTFSYCFMFIKANHLLYK